MSKKLSAMVGAASALDRAQEIMDAAKADARELRPDEVVIIRELQEKADHELIRARGADLHARIEAEQKPNRRKVPSFIDGQTYATEPADRGAVQWRDSKNGKVVRVYRSNESMAHSWMNKPAYRNDSPEDWHPGRYIRALITGRRDFLSDPEARALSTGVNTAGGVMIPDPVAAMLIDKARAASILNRVGAVTVPMETENLRLARVTTDPTFEGKAENAAFTGSDFAFDSVMLISRTIGQVLYSSRELAEDSANFEDLITSALSNAFAAELDRLGLTGSGSGGEPLGIMLGGDVQTTGSVGAVAWTDLLAAIEDVRDQNTEPESYILTPALATSFDSLTTGDGVNAAENFQAAPASVAALRRYVSTRCTSGEIWMGGFRDNAVIGLRHDPRIEITTTGGDTFEKHQLGIKIVWRGDFNAMHHDQLVRLTGAS